MPTRFVARARCPACSGGAGLPRGLAGSGPLPHPVRVAGRSDVVDRDGQLATEIEGVLRRGHPPPCPLAVTGDEHQRRRGGHGLRLHEALDAGVGGSERLEVSLVTVLGGADRAWAGLASRLVEQGHRAPPAGNVTGWSRPVGDEWKDAMCRAQSA